VIVWVVVGWIAMDTICGSLTVRLAVPNLLLRVAVIVTAVLEDATPVATPIEPEAFEIVATEVLLEVQVTEFVMSTSVPLSNVPFAVNGYVLPTLTLAVLGLTVIESSVAVITLTLAVALFPDRVAVTLAVPFPTPVT
jgi:hypothetical protein